MMSFRTLQPTATSLTSSAATPSLLGPVTCASAKEDDMASAPETRIRLAALMAVQAERRRAATGRGRSRIVLPPWPRSTRNELPVRSNGRTERHGAHPLLRITGRPSLSSSGESLMPRTRKQPAVKDAITLLKADHQKVRALLGELTESSERATTKREELLAEIERELKIHTTIEEQIFYPAFRDA